MDCWWTSGGSQGEGPGTNKGATGPLLPLNRKAALSAALSMLSGVLFRHALGVLVDLLGGQPLRLSIGRETLMQGSHRGDLLFYVASPEVLNEASTITEEVFTVLLHTRQKLVLELRSGRVGRADVVDVFHGVSLTEWLAGCLPIR